MPVCEGSRLQGGVVEDVILLRFEELLVGLWTLDDEGTTALMSGTYNLVTRRHIREELNP